MYYGLHPTDIVGYAYWASIYCPSCGSALPDIDPEGNEKAAIFADHDLGYTAYCDSCHTQLIGS